MRSVSYTFVDISVVSWNVYVGLPPEHVRGELKKIINHYHPDVIFLYESKRLFGRLNNLGYQIFQFRPKSQVKGRSSNNGNVTMLVRYGLNVKKASSMWMKKMWFGPLANRPQDPRVYRWAKIEKGGVVWKVGGFHLPFGAKPRRESVMKIRAWFNRFKKRPVIAVGDWQRGDQAIEANIGDPVNANVVIEHIDGVIYKNCGLVKKEDLGKRGSDHPAWRFVFRKRKKIK